MSDMQVNVRVHPPSEYESTDWSHYRDQYGHLIEEEALITTKAGEHLHGYITDVAAYGVGHEPDDNAYISLIVVPFDDVTLEVWIPWNSVDTLSILKEDAV